MRKAISVTLSTDNLLWLKGQAARTGKGSVSEVLDRLVGAARADGRVDVGSVRTVAGTIDVADDDPALTQADSHVRAAFAESLRRPVVVRERNSGVRRGRRG